MIDLWQYLKGASRPIILYGTGDGADKILNAAMEKGINIDGVFASDGFVRKRVFRDMPVLSYKEAVSKYGSDMIILIAFGSSLPSVIERFYALSKLHEVYAPDVPVAGGALFDIDFYNENKDKIEKVRGLFCDERSKNLYDGIIEAKLTGRVAPLFENTDTDEDILSLLGAQSFRITLDLGAYNGDTALKLTEICPKLSTVIALEPDEKNFAKLCFNTASSKKVEAHYGAAWDKDEILTFSKGGGRGIRRRGGERTVSVAGIPPEKLLDGRKVDYIKFDVEGAEAQALEGCKNAIEKYTPAIRLALYHRSEDIFALPLALKEICPTYKFYLRRTMSFPAWDLDLIAIP